MAGVPYTLHFANGQKKNGTLDGNGTSDERNLPDTVTKVVYHNSPAAKDEGRPAASVLLSSIDSLVAKEPEMFTASQVLEGK
jgi:hypothetical protein